jgi:hypothetical protein
MQCMSAMILGQVANALPNNMVEFYVMQIPRVIHPRNELLLDMKPPVQEW